MTGTFVRYAEHGAWHVAHSWADRERPPLALPKVTAYVEWVDGTRPSMVALCGFEGPVLQLTDIAGGRMLKEFTSGKGGGCDHCGFFERYLGDATPEEVRSVVNRLRELFTEVLTPF